MKPLALNSSEGLVPGDKVRLKEGSFPDMETRDWIVKETMFGDSILLRTGEKGYVWMTSPENLVKL